MSEKWKNEVLAEAEVTDKVKWVLQRSTSPDGDVMIGLRKFVETKAGSKPTASGLSVKDKAELEIVIKLLQEGLVDEAPKYIIKTDNAKGKFLLGRGQGRNQVTSDRAQAKVFDDKEQAKAFREKHGDTTWLVVKAKR